MKKQQDVSIAEILNTPRAKEMLKKIKKKAKEDLKTNPTMSLAEFIVELKESDKKENKIIEELFEETK